MTTRALSVASHVKKTQPVQAPDLSRHNVTANRYGQIHFFTHVIQYAVARVVVAAVVVVGYIFLRQTVFKGKQWMEEGEQPVKEDQIGVQLVHEDEVGRQHVEENEVEAANMAAMTLIPLD